MKKLFIALRGLPAVALAVDTILYFAVRRRKKNRENSILGQIENIEKEERKDACVIL